MDASSVPVDQAALPDPVWEPLSQHGPIVESPCRAVSSREEVIDLIK
jgi:hypothetical protein